MHESVFEGITSEKLRGYAVWEPILRTDDQRSARKATTILPDSRVRHYWVDGQEVGEMFQAPLGLEGEPAWDVYLVYPAGIEWTGKRPPKPAYFMHQLGALPAGQRLDGKKLAARLRQAMAKSPVGTQGK